jgi:flagella basal body P-ring formation protein FlgA
MAAALMLGAMTAAADSTILDQVQRAVREDLLKTVSEKAALEELKVIKGAEYLGPNAGNMTIQNLYMDGYSGRNRVVYAVYMRDRQSRTINIVVEASYDIFQDVYVTARPIAKGEVLEGSDFYSVRQKLSKLPLGAITNRKELEGKSLKMSVTDGVIIKSSHLLSALTVKKGKKIDVIVEGTNVSISAKGTLRNDATVGDTANVLCDLTRKEVSGVLVSATLLRVKI